MPLNTHDILAHVALRINALKGVTPTALNTTFTTRPLLVTDFKSAVFPFDAVRDAVVHAEEQLALSIANTPNHPYRPYLRSTTANLAHGAALPTADSGGKTIIGVWGSIRDAVDSKVLKEKTLQEVERKVSNPGGFYKRQYYYFKLEGSHIYHTRTNVTIDCCIYDRATRKTAVINNTAILLPEALEPAYISGAIELLSRDGEFGEQAAIYAQHFKDSLYVIRAGGVNVPPVSEPTGKAKPIEG
jgi:hypothetical protein